MTKMRNFFILFLVISSGLINILIAQTLNDSLTKVKSEKKWIFDSQIDQRNSIIPTSAKIPSTISLPIIGYNMGWVHNERIRLGVGVYYAKSQESRAYPEKYTSAYAVIPKSSLFYRDKEVQFLIQKSVQMYYLTANFEWIFFKSKWLDLSIPIEAGLGYSSLNLTEYFSGVKVPIISPRTGKTFKGDDIFIPATLGLSAMFNLTPDVGFQAGGGYRYVLAETSASQDFNGYFYMVGIQLIPQNIIKNFKNDYKKWKGKHKKKVEKKDTSDSKIIKTN